MSQHLITIQICLLSVCLFVCLFVLLIDLLIVYILGSGCVGDNEAH